MTGDLPRNGPFRETEEAGGASCRNKLTVRTSGSASVGVITEGVDVKSSFGVGIVTGDVPGDGGRGRFGLLLEDDGAGDLRVTAENAHCEGPC